MLHFGRGLDVHVHARQRLVLISPPLCPALQGASTPPKWLRGTVELPADASASGGALLEFVVADAAKAQWDKPPGFKRVIAAKKK